ncbi:MAG: aldehyde dehydrogenase family protein [Deltaproteobacteria bacterium]|nr:MAG: aldehyde dehydrogenase family protein [Deltaproteobacteria bacterium]
MKMYIAGEWIDTEEKIEVLNPYNGEVVDTVPNATQQEVEKALESATRGARVMAEIPAYQRFSILMKAAGLLMERQEEFARLISQESGKALWESRFEVVRAAETIELSAEEAKRIRGETIPLDAASGGKGKFGFTLRVPCGVVVAISPFNFPLNLLCHKVGPGLAAGNAVVAKPPSDTPLSGLRFTELLLEAGLPSEGIQCITGPGGSVGEQLCKDPRVRKISFTGSPTVGERICQVAGIKKVTMELGSNSPLIIMEDADLEEVAKATAATGYALAGQVCISTQRVLVNQRVYGDFLDALTPEVEAIVTGNPLEESTRMGPMIRESDAVRVESWINEAVKGGAKLLTGGGRQGNLVAPTVVADVDAKERISCDELFGPAVAVTRFEDIDQAIAMANDSKYGLSAGIFTRNLDWAMKFVRQVHSGNLMVNWGPQWRVDLMPYGGLKESGFGKEGPKYAVEEMTELKMVVFHL